MSYKTEFQSNNADLQVILDAVNSIGESGNKTYNTCSVTFAMSGGYVASYSYVQVTSSGAKAVTVTPSSKSSVTVNDALCGSVASFTASKAVSTGTTSGGCSRLIYSGSLQGMTVRVPTTAGGTGTATLSD